MIKRKQVFGSRTEDLFFLLLGELYQPVKSSMPKLT